MSLVKLPLSTVKLINSSQVITSLSSVIKELMENAIDAGANNIEIKLEKHGFEKIEVRDDGCGMNSSDIQYVCLPSYTSKITGFSDLENLCCYGFRGEALSSLCAVSQVSITTKTVDDDVAMCYSFNSSGQVISCKASHLPKGTTVCASELFKGLPVRKKLMSSSRRASEELRKLENVVKSIGVIHPWLRVIITHNKFLIWQKTSISNLRQSVTQVFTQSVVTKLHQIHYSNELMKLEMMIPKRDCDVSSLCFSSLSDALYIFINKRIVVDKKIHKVVMDELTQYFGHYIPASKYPICIIILTVPANTLDVNLEPNKSRVLLQYMDEILETFRGQLRLYYYESLLTPKINEEQYNDIKSNKKRKIELDQSTEAFTATNLQQNCVVTNGNAFINLLKGNEYNDYVEDAGKVRQEQDAKNVLESLGNPYIHTNENKEETYVGQTIEVEGANNINLNMVRVPESNRINSNNSVLELTSDEGKLISTGNCVAGALNSETCEYSCTSENAVYHITPTLNDISNTSENQSVLNENCGHGIKCMESLQVDELATNLNQRIVGENFTKTNNVTVILNNNNKCNEETVTSKNWDLVSKNVCNIGKNVVIGPNINNDKYVKNIDVCNNEETKKYAQTPTISQWSRGETDSLGSLEVSSALKNEYSHLEGQVNCADVHVIECTANDKVRNQLINEEMLSFIKGSSKLKAKVLRKKGNQDICVKDHVVENDKNICNNRVKVANIDREEKIVQKHNENIVIEKKYIEIEIDFSEFQPFTYSNFYEPDMCTVIGQLEASPLWVYRRNNEIGVTSVIRLHEAVQFHKNLESMSIPIKMLESNISIKEGDLGSALWNVLLSLEKQDHCVADERITKNGFVIEISDDGEDDIRATITYTALHIAYYGLDELIELLQMVKNQDKSLSLLHFRPLKVISYIRSETMRQCYFSTPSFENESVNELLSFWFMYVMPNCGSCIHHKPVVLPLPT